MIRLTILLMLTAALSGCASLSDADDFAASAPDHSSRPKIVGASGPLSARATRRLLDKIAPEPGESRLLRRHLTIEQAVAGTPLIADNRTQLLRDGPDTFAAMFAAMKGAKHHINLEYYILEDVESGGTPLSDLLLAKRREGVAVHVIYDSYGSGSTPSEFFDKLKAAGIHLLAFNPVNPLETRTSYSLNDRDHRKILVVDGATAIVGGINLSTTYESNRFGRAAAPQTEAADHWRDTDLVIEGPAVAELQHLFVEHWMSQNGPPLDDATFFPPVPPKGNEVVRIIGSTPDNAIPRYYVTLVSAIRTAERSVWLSAAYFVPTHQEKEDLEDAARRGVDVRLLLPAKSDSDRALAVAHSHYEDLMEAGVKIYEVANAVLHSKTVVIDGVWSAVGSSNFDQRSVLFNDEVDAVVLGDKTAEAMEEMFRQDIAKATLVDLAQWRDRPFSERIDEFFSGLWQRLL